MNFHLSKQVTVDRGLNGTPGSAVLEVRIVKKENMFGYNEQGKRDFLRVTLAQPRFVAAAKRVVEAGFQVQPNGATIHFGQTFETNVDFEIRFMIDNKVFGCNWIELKATKYRVRTSPREIAGKLVSYPL